MIQYLPGEKEAIETVKALGAQYGYGNLIMQLKAAWSEMLQEKHGLSPIPELDPSAFFDATQPEDSDEPE